VRIEEHTTLPVAPEKVWAHLVEPDNYPAFMEGVVRWEVEGERRTGRGARWSIRMRVGTAFVGGLVEVVEFDEGRELAWTSITGVDHRGRFRLRSRRPGETEVTFRLSFTLPGGLLSRLAERIAGRAVAANVRRSLERLREQLVVPRGGSSDVRGTSGRHHQGLT
jgi:uncharacterized membrane protein